MPLMKGLIAAVCVAAMAPLQWVVAGAPVQNMGVAILGVEYLASVRGQTITAAAVPSIDRLQLFNLHYAPVPYAMLSLGLGGSRYSVEEYRQTRFDGRYGLTPAVGLSLFTPRFLSRVVSLTVAGKGVYLNSSNRGDIRYRGAILNPSGGIKLSLGPWVDWEMGAMGHFMYGTIEADRTSSSFSNNQTLRGYTEITLHDAALGVYLSTRFDASPAIGSDWSRGPAEATLALAIGLMLSPDREYRAVDDRNSRWFPRVKRMREKQREMAEEIR